VVARMGGGPQGRWPGMGGGPEKAVAYSTVTLFARLRG
jgi:hypothetical protein